MFVEKVHFVEVAASVLNEDGLGALVVDEVVMVEVDVFWHVSWLGVQ